MKKALSLLLLSGSLFVHAQKNTMQKGWMALSDGKTTRGWHSYGSSVAGSAWEVRDGAFCLNMTNGKKGGDLTTDEEFGNFDLKLEWKISPKGNSGIIFLVHEDTALYKASYFTGLEMQVLDNDGHPDGKYYKHRAGDLYDLVASSKETVKPVGEWNQSEIICNRGSLKLYLNGTNVVTTTLWDEHWKELVAHSKFKNFPPGFAQYHKGRISLQEHDGNEVCFRNIMIKKL
jgi:hypothetical protein